MRRPRLYLETSVWNFLFAEDAAEKKAATVGFFREVESGKYVPFVSEAVMNEINRAPLDKQAFLTDAIRKYRPYILEDSKESQELAAHYIENGLLSVNHLDDLSHVAIATVNDIDILTSWNLRHIVRQRTRTMVNALNRLYGYHELDICTPEEVVDYEIYE